MKKKIGIVFCVIAVLAVGGMIWYMAPKYFLKGVTASEVSCINVFDGNTGEGFTIDDPEQIAYIVENVQGVKMKKGRFSLGYMGYRFRVSFVDENGKVLESLILNGEDTIRRDPFFYTAQEGILCYGYFEQLEQEASQQSFRAVIQEIGSGYMLVEPVPESDERRSSDLISVGTSLLPASPEPEVGDTVEIVYDGAIMETYPAQLGEVYSITVEQSGEETDGLTEREPDESGNVPKEQQTDVSVDSSADYPALVRVNGSLYYDSGEISTALRCGMMDGQITSSCDGVPSEDDQSNFGEGYGYQRVGGTIEVLIDGEWHIFIPYDV